MVAAVTASLAAIDSLQATLRVAGALVASGRAIDLVGLEVDVCRLCAAIQLVPPEQAKPLRPALVGLLQDLDRITVAIILAEG